MADQIGSIPTINGSSVTFLAVIAAAVVLLILIWVGWCCCRRRSRRNRLTRASKGNNLSTLHPTPHAGGSGRRAGFAPLGQHDDDEAFNAAPSPRASHDIEYANPYAQRYAGYDEPGTAPGLGRAAYPPAPAAAPSQRSYGHQPQQSSYSQPRREEGSQYEAYPPAASHSYAGSTAPYGSSAPDSTGYVPPPSSASVRQGSQLSSPTAAPSVPHSHQHLAHAKATDASAYPTTRAGESSAAPYDSYSAARSSSAAHAPQQPYPAAGSSSMPAAPYAAGPTSPMTDAPPPEYDFTTGAAASGDRKQGLH